MKKTFILVILDGYGVGELDESNPIYIARPQTLLFLHNNFPAGALQASGMSVGLPWDEEGNSEVGHLTIGAGKILYQHYPRISLAIEDKTFFENKVLKGAFAHAKKHNSAVHLTGLLTKGSVHAYFSHLVALLELAKKEGVASVYLQLFSDGKDSPPHSVEALLKSLESAMQQIGIGTIASISGRYYAMDRDDHWDRTEAAYKVLVGESGAPKELEAIIKESIANDLNDEFITPTAVHETHPIQENDAIIFFNFREDSMRQITHAFADKTFARFTRKEFQNIFVATMTQYADDIHAEVAFPREIVENCLGKVLADNNLTQLRIAETEKYAHVTYFFNGLHEKPYQNEFRVLIPSQSVARHDERPEMMAEAVTNRALAAINENGFDFILINYANPDLIAHTGNFEATVQAIKVVDTQIARLLKVVLEGGHTMLITSDHGNAENLIDLKTGEPETKHDPNPVPVYLVGAEYQKGNTYSEVPRPLETIGLLSDVAPTILELLKIPKPSEMTGQSLMEEFL